jgi:SpoVK/Ycf46/Vps4 family AAA+-type ATPase
LTGSDGGIKRQLAQTLSNESGLTFLAPTLSDFKANYSGQSGNRVKLFFERARASSPAIVFLDRLDMIAPNRNVANATDALSNEIIGSLVELHPDNRVVELSFVSFIPFILCRGRSLSEPAVLRRRTNASCGFTPPRAV